MSLTLDRAADPDTWHGPAAIHAVPGAADRLYRSLAPARWSTFVQLYRFSEQVATTLGPVVLEAVVTEAEALACCCLDLDPAACGIHGAEVEL